MREDSRVKRFLLNMERLNMTPNHEGVFFRIIRNLHLNFQVDLLPLLTIFLFFPTQNTFPHRRG